MPPILYLVPNLLSDTDPSRSLPAYNMEAISHIRHFIVETPKTARLLLKKCGLKSAFDDITFYVLNEHTKDNEIAEIIAPLLSGNDMGLISDAGYPVIADPGEIVVGIAQKNGIRVVPLTGPNSIFLALAASGLDAEKFTFHGYLPVKELDRSRKIKEIEEQLIKTGYTQIFIETPYRNLSMLNDLFKNLRQNILLCIAADINSEKEFIVTKSISDWRKDRPDLNKRPTVFLIGK